MVRVPKLTWWYRRLRLCSTFCLLSQLLEEKQQEDDDGLILISILCLPL
jgi:hypothetical protein